MQNKFRMIISVVLSALVLAPHVFAYGPIALPTATSITDASGNVTFSVSQLYGGAGVYLKDKRIPDSTPANGNTINYSQAGALFQTAIWTLPVDESQRHICDDWQKAAGACPDTGPFSNPTQGGYL